MKKIISLVLSLVLILSAFPICVSAAELSSDEKTDVVIGMEYTVEMPSFVEDTTVSVIVDDLLKHSTILTYGTSMEGTYESENYNAGLSGYTFQIQFSWKAGVNSSGEYVFNDISDAKIVTHRNDLVCGMSWSYCDYELTENLYTISSNKKSVTFETTYEFEFIIKDDPFASLHTTKTSHTHAIKLDEII